MSGKTSTAAKSKYNKTAYKQYILRVRKNSELCEAVEGFKSQKGTSLNHLIIKLLCEHFNTPMPDPMDNYFNNG